VRGRGAELAGPALAWQRDQRVAAVPDDLVDRDLGAAGAGDHPVDARLQGPGLARRQVVGLGLRPEPGIRRGRPRVVSHRWGGGERDERRGRGEQT
jgi:hypothetical protein